MEKVFGIILLFLLLTINYVEYFEIPEEHELNPDYGFTLAWQVPPHTSSYTHFTDLDGDGLTEILYFDKDKEENSIFTVLDTFGNVLWSITVDKTPYYLGFRDIDGDNFKEIFFTTQMTSRSTEEETQQGKHRITCYNSQGILLWSHTLTVNPKWDGFHSPRFKISSYIDVNKDGTADLIKGNTAFDINGDILSEYGEDYTVIGSVTAGSERRLVFVKEIDIFFDFHDFTLQDYVIYLRITELDGTVVWEKEFSEHTKPEIIEIDGEKRLFLLQKSAVSEVDPLTCTEKMRIDFDFDDRSILFLPELFVLDVDDDGQVEYVITASSPSDYGKGAVFVYDTALKLKWEYRGSKFHTDVTDMDGDGKYEYLVDYDIELPSRGAAPTYFRLLDYDTSERWTLFFEDFFIHPESVDIDVDGDVELIFAVDLRPDPYEGMSLAELLQKLKEYLENPPPSRKRTEYLYILDLRGEIEKQLEVYYGIREFRDMDNDGDLDLVLHVKTDDGGLYMYSNTRFTGPLDQDEGSKESLAVVYLGEKGVQRNFRWSPEMHYAIERFKHFFTHFIFVPDSYVKKMTILLSIPLILGLIFSYFLVRTLQKKNNWEPLWSGKRALLYMLLLVVSPVGLLYFGWKVVKSSDEYRKALGFIKISIWQFFVSIAVGAILYAINLGFALLSAANQVQFPDTGVQEFLQDYLAAALFLIVITAPIVEEILFSGYLYPILRKRIGVKRGIALTSLVFAALHLQITLIPFHVVHAVIKLYAYERTHCIYVPIIIHSMYNVVFVALTLLPMI